MNIVSSMNLVVADMKAEKEYSDNYIQTNLIQLMIVIIVISFACLLALIPLYSFIQYKRGKLLELFSTFSLVEIEGMA